ncbi:MAG TPA: tRNA (adenosine(37)-N6)-threonylcarbamoyltransferase complex transferase subunit TsaD [Elusimicrobia bacterium]|nr:tRNA (adenosine(37)-N6)-threonylcarbamoyltransferase complex transferase subunit TsaD [Elusimicrobiota bacterium]
MARVLGIETSCDETAAAVVDGRRILSNVVSSQVDLHAEYAGVVPELASRAHLERLPGVIEAALRRAFGGEASLSRLEERVDAVAYAQGPGLAGALLVGKVAAQTIARARRLPLIGVNHLEAHALAMGLLEAVRYPLLSLVVSGGHTELMEVKGPGKYRVLGRTRDDAAGEVFDKVAKFLRLGYPGGPVIDRLAKSGDPRKIAFPRPLLPGCWDFSFSGLKTAVLYHVRDAGYASGDRVRPAVPAGRPLPRKSLADLVASFQEAVVDTLIEKTVLAARKTRVRTVVVGGGVAANSRLRARFAERARAEGLRVLFPPLDLCTDNAAMIAHVGSLRCDAGRLSRRWGVDPGMPVRSWG